MTYAVEVQAMQGLGDTVYQRPFIRALVEKRRLQEVYVCTSWPQLFSDMPFVRCIRPETSGLRTQEKNVARSEYVKGPGRAEYIRPRYRLQGPGATICSELAESMGVKGWPVQMDLPDFGECPLDLPRPLALLRPVTHRKEWLNTSRSPRPEYLCRAALLLQGEGWTVVVAADVDGDQKKGAREWLEPPVPVGHQLLKGELTAEDLLALAQTADLVVGGVGWIVPVGLATGRPTVVVGGGNGAHNAPEVIAHPWARPHMRFILPDRYCLCADNRHRCNKEIDGFGARFLGAVQEVAA